MWWVMDRIISYNLPPHVFNVLGFCSTEYANVVHENEYEFSPIWDQGPQLLTFLGAEILPETVNFLK